MTIDIDTLLTRSTAASIWKYGLELAQALGLVPTSWRVGDPTRATFKFVADILGTYDAMVSEFIYAGWLSKARGDWLTVLAEELYGVTREAATYATPTVTLTNTGGGYYPLEVGDVTVKSTLSGQTYHSTQGGTLAAGTSLTLTFEADAVGSAGAVGVDEIDELVTTLLGVTIAGNTTAIGVDEQGDDDLKEACRNTLGALSPNGPPDAYAYVAKNSALTGVTEVTRARAVEDSTTGIVTVYLAGASGSVTAGAVTAVQSAIDIWARPLTIRATAVNSTEVVIPLTVTLGGTGIPVGIASDVSIAYAALLSGVDIGGLVARSAIVAALHSLLVAKGVTSPTVTLTLPAADVQLATGQIGIAGTVTVS